MNSPYRTVLASLVLLAASLGIAGCTSYPAARLTEGEQAAAANLIVFRGDAANAGLVSAYLTIDASLETILRNKQFARLAIAPGRHEAVVKGPAGEAAQITFELPAGEKACVQVLPNPSNALKALTPLIGIYYGQMFLVLAGPCPSAEALAGFFEVGAKPTQK